MLPNILHDGPLDIATGRSRRETNWKNKQIQWSELLDKLQITHRTAETYSEYLSSKKSRQDEIKDIGGFVGGFLTGGRRKSGSVMHRQLLTLDLDFAEAGVWEDFTMLYDNACCLYSTHKHSGDSPRYRLIMPLDREVTRDEYIAIARKIAGIIGINLFDPTTYQPERLMYWPSTAKDAEYVFQYQDGPWTKTDEILSSYRDWRDSSEWPMAERESGIILKAIKKQGDPLEKPGVVGAFCRTYTIHEAIDTYLADVYDACDMPGRYTYKEGSTAAGLITYDDKYAFSHHGTDPVSGKLCNAFDLVRLHHYGLRDEDVRDGTPGNKLPSYLEMLNLATADPKVRKQLGSEKMAEARSDFAGITDELQEGQEPADDSWLEQLDVDRKGNYYPTIHNLVLMLENDPAFKGNISYDEFEQRPVAKRNLPWRKITANSKYLIDRDDDNIEHYLEKTYDIATTKLEKALSVIYERTMFHPVRDYLNSLEWDGESRVENLLIDYMGAEDSDYVRAVTRKTLVAAVARVFKPGIKFDNVLTLVGDEGKGKSTLLKKLGRHWFSDTFNLHMLQSKEGFEQIRGVWIIEIGEMSGMAKAEVERIKGFISAQEDRYRQAYGRRVENFPRQNIFIGTTNKPDFLRGQYGNRRFWPVEINMAMATKVVFTDLDETEVDQIWAEALHLYRKGESLYLGAKLEQFAVVKQQEHTEEHPWAGMIEAYLDKKLPEDWAKMNKYDRIAFLHGDDELQAEGMMFRTRACVLEIWTEGLVRKDSIDSYNASIIRDIMRKMPGWREETKPMKYGIYGAQRRGFVRSEIAKELQDDAWLQNRLQAMKQL